MTVFFSFVVFIFFGFELSTVNFIKKAVLQRILICFRYSEFALVCVPQLSCFNNISIGSLDSSINHTTGEQQLPSSNRKYSMQPTPTEYAPSPTTGC
jgi:hypothetical protein